ncbi:hypothetical protein BX265_7342 [Streptomyces sp. TLI_235]|nr:hypothetical protein BX265_7342 [Streptomyces sp. TLI_235]
MTWLDNTDHPLDAAPQTSGTDPLTLVVGVHLVLTDGDTVLLGRRQNTTRTACGTCRPDTWNPANRSPAP